jgi:penicillin-binding protein 2
MTKNSKEYSFLLFLLIIWVILFFRLFQLQLISGNFYYKTSQDIRARIMPSPAPRGLIYDRNNHILAGNKPAYSIYIMPAEIKNKNSRLLKLSKITGVPVKTIREKLQRSNNMFEPIMIKDHVSFKTISYIEETSGSINFPEINIGVRNSRYYPNNSVAAHVLGHVGPVSKKTQLQNPKLNNASIVGLSGIEKHYDKWLRGTGGGQKIEVDSFGNPVRKLKPLPAKPGKEIQLTIDHDLQKYAEKLLGTKKGAIIVQSVLNGEILALVSNPSFNPNWFTQALSVKAWKELLLKKENPFHNRALTAYPPGSTFKIIPAIAAIEKKYVTMEKQYYCRGFFQFGRRRALCWKKHGKLSFRNAIIHSCNTVFYDLGIQLGIETIRKYAATFGLGSSTGIDLPMEEIGLLPSQDWIKKNKSRSWYPGDSMNAAVGQGFIQVTPLQLAVMTSALAHPKNHIYRPFICKKIFDDHTVYYENPGKVIGTLPYQKDTINLIRNALWQTTVQGTGRAAYTPKIKIVGKTGTAEDKPRPKPHAWYTCYAPMGDPKITVVVFLEGGGHGGSTAAPLARRLILWWNKYRN